MKVGNKMPSIYGCIKRERERERERKERKKERKKETRDQS
jgi:hypothetical protein